jgi:hypothetical protein
MEIEERGVLRKKIGFLWWNPKIIISEYLCSSNSSDIK